MELSSSARLSGGCLSRLSLKLLATLGRPEEAATQFEAARVLAEAVVRAGVRNDAWKVEQRNRLSTVAWVLKEMAKEPKSSR